MWGLYGGQTARSQLPEAGPCLLYADSRRQYSTGFTADSLIKPPGYLHHAFSAVPAVGSHGVCSYHPAGPSALQPAEDHITAPACRGTHACHHPWLVPPPLSSPTTHGWSVPLLMPTKEPSHTHLTTLTCLCKCYKSAPWSGPRNAAGCLAGCFTALCASPTPSPSPPCQ